MQMPAGLKMLNFWLTNNQNILYVAFEPVKTVGPVIAAKSQTTKTKSC